MQCTKCGGDLGDYEDRAAVICTVTAGDEYIYSYWHCGSCGFYTLETCRDRFIGSPIVTVDAPIEPKDGDALVAMIAECPNPSDKWCKCESHRTLFGGN